MALISATNRPTYYLTVVNDNNIAEVYIFQYPDDLRLLLESIDTQAVADRLTIDHFKQLNSYGRFVKLKDTPQWIIHELSDGIRKAKEILTMEQNEM